jgi:hypothetical protein
MPTEMTSAEALAYAHAHAAVERALGFPDDVRERADNALAGFKRLGEQQSYGVFRDISPDIKDLLATAWLQVENAKQLLEKRMRRAKAITRAIHDTGHTRRLFDAMHADALRSYRIGLADPRLLPADAFRDLENTRDLCRELPSLEAQARALYGFSAKRIRGVGLAQRGATRRFIYETSILVSDHKSHGKLVAPLICPVLGIDWLTPEDVRKHLYAYRS